jgi:pyridoxal phosphate enzyme (YggS family)
MNDLKQNLKDVRSRISKACERAGRNADAVRLLAVGKKHPAERIRRLFEAGQVAFGENYVQEAAQKMQELADLAIEWHYIGPIQSNKTREIANHFDWVQSVDRLKVLQRLSAQRPQDLPELNICIQVNIDREPQKAGVLEENLDELLQAARALPGLKLRGLMCIPRAPSADHDPSASYSAMARLFGSALDMDTLSMGMSADLEQAVAAGSTMVRIGTDLFGPRPS